MKEKKRKVVRVQQKPRKKKKKIVTIGVQDEDEVVSSEGEEEDAQEETGTRAQDTRGNCVKQQDPLQGKIRAVLPEENLRRAMLWCAPIGSS